MNPLRPLPVNLDDLAEALHFEGGEFAWYFDLETGSLHLLPDRIEQDPDADVAKIEKIMINYGMEESTPTAVLVCSDLDRFVRVDSLPSRDDYELMVQFAESVENRRLQDLLEVALNGRGAFRRFKDVLFDYPDDRARWFAFEAEAHRSQAVEWLAELGVRPA